MKLDLEKIKNKMTEFEDEKYAKAYCWLSSWETPKSLRIGRKLSKQEIGQVMTVIRERRKVWMKMWQKDPRYWGAVEK